MPLKRLFFVSLVGCLPLSAADDERTRKPDVVMPVMKVPAARLERFGISNQKFVDREGRGDWRLLIWHAPTSFDSFSVFVGGAHLGDEIVSINGREVTAIPKAERQALLRGDFRIVVKRPAGRRSFRFLELDGHGG